MKNLTLLLVLIFSISKQDSSLKGSYIYETDITEILDKDVKIFYERNYDIIEFTDKTYTKKLRNDVKIIGNIKSVNKNVFQLRDSIMIFPKGQKRLKKFDLYIEFKKTENDTINFQIKKNSNDEQFSTGRFIKL